MSRHPFLYLMDLVSLDDSIRDLNRQLREHAAAISASAEKIEITKARIAQAQKKVHELRKKVDELELLARDTSAKELSKKKQLDAVKTDKEYRSVVAEVETLQQKKNILEEEQITTWMDLESAQKELQRVLQENSSQLHTHEAEKKKREEQNQACLALRAEYEAQRPSKVSQVPDEWMQVYQGMREHVEDPVVPIMQGGCSACGNAMTSQEMLRAQRRAILQCKNCFRLLFLHEAIDAAARGEYSEKIGD